MKSSDLALVYLSDNIPIDGFIFPIAESNYLYKRTELEYANQLLELLKSEHIINDYDYAQLENDEYVKNYFNECNDVLKNYLPYVSKYKSVISTTINGIIHEKYDHVCALIMPIESVIDQVISLTPVDTMLNSSIKISKEHILIINYDYYEILSNDKKEQLTDLDCQIKFVKSSLSKAVESELLMNGYDPESLEISRLSSGFKKSNTYAKTLDTIKNYVKRYNLAEVNYDNIMLKENMTSKFKNMKDEYLYSFYIYDYYMKMFFEELLSSQSINKQLISRVLIDINSKNNVSIVMKVIKNMGINNYKKFLDEYNKTLENTNLLTPKEIINKYYKEGE